MTGFQPLTFRGIPVYPCEELRGSDIESMPLVWSAPAGARLVRPDIYDHIMETIGQPTQPPIVVCDEESLLWCRTVLGSAT